MRFCIWSLPFALIAWPVSATPINDAEQAYARQDHATALRRYRQLAEHGNALAQFNYAMMLKRGEGGTTKDNWQDWLSKAATAGLPEAAYVLGIAYENGEGVVRSQPDATRWFLKAARSGHTAAQLSVGTQYFLGRGTTRDMAQAAHWYEKAAEGGDMAAQYLIASLYESGDGVAIDRGQALMWYGAAARQGDITAKLKAEALARR
ncbi:tetratricopeptide repeat protein [Chitinimonas naiadis]